MILSIDTTRPTRHKFMFETDFEQEAERMRLEAIQREEQARQKAEIVPEPQKPMFDEESLTAAREEGYNRGFEQGKRDALSGIEQQLISLENQFLLKLEIILEHESKREEIALTSAIRTAISVIKKIWPEITEKIAETTLYETIGQNFTTNNTEARMVIRVPDRFLDAVVQRLPQLKEQQAFTGKVVVLADETLASGDCRIEWADGGMERINRHIVNELDAIIDRLLSAYQKQDDNQGSQS